MKRMWVTGLREVKRRGNTRPKTDPDTDSELCTEDHGDRPRWGIRYGLGLYSVFLRTGITGSSDLTGGPVRGEGEGIGLINLCHKTSY